MSWPYIQLGAMIVATLFALSRLLLSRQRRNLPPGPRGWPIFGNSFNVPQEYEWLAYQRWGAQYGQPTFCLSAKYNTRCQLTVNSDRF